jgi:hypothetical protein
VRFPARALAGLVILASSITLASAQGTPPSNSQVEIEYIRPQKREYQPIHDRLKNRKVLEQLQQFLSPLRLPQKLTIKIDQCGAPSRPYKSDGVATICYEIVEQIERAASGLNGEARSSAIAGAFIQATMYQVSVAVLDILDFPIWGRTGDAADRLSAFVMQNFGEDLAIRTVIATARFFEATRRTWTGSAFASADSPEEQRFYNYLCIAYGGSPISFRFLVASDKNQLPILPIPRARRCAGEYAQVRQAFNLRIMPYVDPQLLVYVRSRDWLQPNDVK